MADLHVGESDYVAGEQGRMDRVLTGMNWCAVTLGILF
jgi:hypothetical protein